MNPYTTLKKGTKVVVHRKSYTEHSGLKTEDVGKIFTVHAWETQGRRHNRYISQVYLKSSKHGDRTATVGEIALCNPNYEPEGEFIVCVGCGATVAETHLKTMKQLANVRSCPSCGMLDPTVS